MWIKEMGINESLWSNDDLAIFKKFYFKCIRCSKPAIVIHEIKPKSRRPKNWMEVGNRVPLCRNCHNWAHKISCKQSAIILKRILEEYGSAILG